MANIDCKWSWRHIQIFRVYIHSQKNWKSYFFEVLQPYKSTLGICLPPFHGLLYHYMPLSAPPKPFEPHLSQFDALRLTNGCRWSLAVAASGCMRGRGGKKQNQKGTSCSWYGASPCWISHWGVHFPFRFDWFYRWPSVLKIKTDHVNLTSWLCRCRWRCGSKTAGPNRKRTPPRTRTNVPPPPMSHWQPATSCASWSRAASCRALPRHLTPSWGLHTRHTMARCWAARAEAPPPLQASAAAPLPAPYQGGRSGCRCPRWAAPRPHRGWAFHRHTPSASPCHCWGALITNWPPPTGAVLQLLSRTCGWTGRRQIWEGRRRFLK